MCVLPGAQHGQEAQWELGKVLNEAAGLRAAGAARGGGWGVGELVAHSKAQAKACGPAVGLVTRPAWRAGPAMPAQKTLPLRRWGALRGGLVEPGLAHACHRPAPLLFSPSLCSEGEWGCRPLAGASAPALRQESAVGLAGRLARPPPCACWSVSPSPLTPAPGLTGLCREPPR